MPDPHDLSRRDFLRQLGSRRTLARLAGGVFGAVGSITSLLHLDADRERSMTAAVRSWQGKTTGTAPAERRDALASPQTHHQPLAADHPNPESRLQELQPGAPVYNDSPTPLTGTGGGLTEAPRGALGHCSVHMLRPGKNAQKYAVTVAATP